jgi:branched-chain amino acid transport system ATP-binding protein
MLEVESIDIYYGDLQALFDVSISIQEKEIVVVCGSNGSGKSTLLKAIIGILRPRGGCIKFFGQRIDKIPVYSHITKGLCLIPEGGRIFPYSTVKDNLSLGAYTANRKMSESLEFVYETFPVLRTREKRLARTLSGGEQQMLALGRGLMSEPKILLLDEPSLGLAPMIVTKIFEVIHEINKEKGITILLSEQNVYKALGLSNRAYILEIGKVVLDGDSEEILNNDMVKKAYLGL